MNVIKTAGKALVLAAFLMVGFTVSAQEFNKLDAQGKKHGTWKGVHAESKRPRYEGTFEHGKEVGTFKFFDDTKVGQVVATREFKPDGSAYTIFYKDGKYKVSEGKEVNKLYEGEWKYYHENLPDIMTLENYKAGKLHGKRTVYYRGSGIKGEENIAEEAHYANGLKHGSYKSYTLKGTLLEDSNYKNGQLDGPASYFDPLGKLTAQGIYKDGKKVGKWAYYKDGKLLKKDNEEVIKKRRKPSKPKLDPTR